MMRRSVAALQPWGWHYAKGGGERVIIPSRDEWWGREAGSQESHEITSDAVDLAALRKANPNESMVEMKMANLFKQQLKDGTCTVPEGFTNLAEAGMTREEVGLLLKAGYATSLVHVESRIASALGLAFYTIGPGGEELSAAVGAILKPDDAMALHYRHTSASIARQLKAGKSLEQILLDRARGHTVSSLDPVTGGHHCAIGGSDYDFLVTSTLASQVRFTQLLPFVRFTTVDIPSLHTGTPGRRPCHRPGSGRPAAPALPSQPQCRVSGFGG